MTRDIYYNYQSRFLSDSAGKAVSADQELVYKDQPVWVIYPVDDAGNPIDLSGVVAFSANVAQDFLGSTPPMCHTDAAAISVVGNGVSVPLDAATTQFLDVVDGKETVDAFFDLVGLDADAMRVFYLRFPIRAGALLNPGDDVPNPVEGNFLTAVQVYALLAALFDWADPYDFITTSETGETITFTAADLGVDAESCDFEVVQVLETEKKTVTNDAAISRTWTSAGYVVTYAGGWPAGTWQLRAGKVKGDDGRDGMVYDRETMTGVTITASMIPKTHYYTAANGDVLTTDWSAVGGKDATIWLKLTMPSPVVTITLPSDITKWKDDFGNDVSAPDMSTAGTYWIFIHKDAAQVWATGKKVA